jgi:hypothetical protein
MTFKFFVRDEEGEKHHLKKWVAEMEAILNICANKKNVH